MIAQALMDKETLTAAELKEMVFGKSEDDRQPPIDLTKNEPPAGPVDLVKKVEEKIADSIFEPGNSNPEPI